MDKSLIQIFRGDDTDGLGYQSIQGKITTTLDLTGCRAVFRYLGFTQEFDPIPENGRITITMPASATSKFPPGLGYASLRVYDSEGKVRTFTNRIPVFVTVYAPSECGGEFEVVFNGGNLELEPLKIKSVNGYRIYDGYLEQIIDKATAVEYGLALLFDSGDSGKDANSGYAATPKAVQAAYDAIIGELTDNYYNAEETEEAIDRIAAYYITADAQGNPFATYAALTNATEFYSGGQLRTPTRNDYCVVLADETHGGEQYRYIYSVNQQGAGQWEAQYAVGGSVELDNTVTRTSGNGVKSSGIWSAIWGALTALPTGFSSLYDWCVAQLAGKAPATNIAKSALAQDVQASLGKADTALQTAPVTSVNGKTGAVALTASDVGAVPLSDEVVYTERGIRAYYNTRPAASDLGILVGTGSATHTFTTLYSNASISGWKFNEGTRATLLLPFPWASKTENMLALLSDIAVKSVKLNGTAITPDANGAVDVQALGNSGNQTLNGTLSLNSNNGSIRTPVIRIAYNTPDSPAFNDWIIDRDAAGDLEIRVPTNDGSYTTFWLNGRKGDSAIALFSDLAPLAPLASPAFTGTPTAPTPNEQSADTQIANKKYVDDAVAGGGGGNLDYVMRVDPETGGIYYTTPDTNA